MVAGGPLFTTGYEAYEGVDCFVLGEAEATPPHFLADLAKGCPQQIYSSDDRPDITKTPVPLWSLINMKHYSAMSLQYFRGCPFDCDFCDIIVLNGYKLRTKDRQQVVDELEALYRHGWRGSVFIVDDNFIGNKKKLKVETLPTIIQWSREKKYPFTFFTEASINLADDEQLMELMVEAGFNRVFIGIETPNVDSLVECNKLQNRNRDLAASVKKIQNHGSSFKEVKRRTKVIGRFPNETSDLVMVFSILDEERLKWQKVRMRTDDIAWIEEASKALEQEPDKLEFLEEALAA